MSSSESTRTALNVFQMSVVWHLCQEVAAAQEATVLTAAVNGNWMKKAGCIVIITEPGRYFNDSTNGSKGALLTSGTTRDGYQVDENGVWNRSF